MNRSRLLLNLLRSLLLAASVACAVQAQTPLATPAAAPPPPAARPAMLLLLPTQTSAFAKPAEALREGFFAAHKVSGDDVALQVVETDDSTDQMNTALASAGER
jgi:hypothetical protein